MIFTPLDEVPLAIFQFRYANAIKAGRRIVYSCKERGIVGKKLRVEDYAFTIHQPDDSRLSDCALP